MTFSILIPFFIGLSVVTQGVLNRQIGAAWGLGAAVFLNASVLFVLSSLLFLGLIYFPQSFPSFLQLSSPEASRAQAWFVIPGLCGLLIVIGVPWSLQMNGPGKTFILVIVAQIIFSLLFEKFFFGLSLSLMKIMGALFVAVGAALVAFS